MELALEGLDKFIEKSMKERKIPGLGIGIVKDGNIMYARGFGYADIENKKEVTPDTVFRIGSISKTFTAIALMQQWEKGKFQLDDPVLQYLPRSKIRPKKKNAPPITFKDLFTHTSGIGELLKKADLFRIKHFVNVNREKIYPLNKLFDRKIKLKVNPGEKWAYSNFGFNLLGYLLEKLSNEEFSRYMLDNIFEPLDMGHSDFAWSDRVKVYQAKGYKLKKGNPIEFGTNSHCHMPAGSAYSSINDMLKYIICMLNGGKIGGKKEILKTETLQKMWIPYYQVEKRLPAMGLAFWLFDVEGYKILNHGGSINGYMSEMYLLPNEKMGMIVCINKMSLKDMGAIRIAHEILHKILKLEDFKEKTQKIAISSDPLIIKEVSGRYGPKKGFLTNIRHYMGGGEIKIFSKDNDLFLRTMWGGRKVGVKLWPDSKDPYFFRIFDKLNYTTVEPSEDLIFKKINKRGLISYCKGFNEIIKKSWYKSFKFKLYSRTTIVLMLIAFLVLLFIIY